MQTTATARPELLQVADAVARERLIDREEVLTSMEQAIQRAAKQKYGLEHDIRATVDRKSGAIDIRRYREVVENDELEDELTQIKHRDANVFQKGLQVGEFYIEPLPPIDLGRIAAQSSKQVLVQEIRGAERARQFEEFKDKEGEIVNGLIKRIEYGNVTVDLGRAEAILRRDEQIPRENLRVGDRVRAYIYRVSEEQRGPQIFLSRTHPMFMAKLFAMEVPEIYEGVITIRAVARDPGSRAKIAVISSDTSIDPVGACVGMRGSRVQAVVGELQGEKVDIIPYEEDEANFVVNALAPAEITKVLVDEERRKMEVVVPEDQLSLAIGRRGQNVRLAGNLTGYDIDIMTEEDEAKRRQEEFERASQLFMAGLDVDDSIGYLLAAEGYRVMDQIAFAPIEEIAAIEGFDDEIAQELINRANLAITAEIEAMRQQLAEQGMDAQVLEIEAFSTDMLKALAAEGIKTLDDLGDLAGDELVELLAGFDMDEDKANEIIMAARAHWFDD